MDNNNSNFQGDPGSNSLTYKRNFYGISTSLSDQNSMSEFDNTNKEEEVAEVQGTVATEGGSGSAEVTADGVETNWNEVVSSFDDMDLKEDLLRGVWVTD
jgi:hypothetical protein